MKIYIKTNENKLVIDVSTSYRHDYVAVETDMFDDNISVDFIKEILKQSEFYLDTDLKLKKRLYLALYNGTDTISGISDIYIPGLVKTNYFYEDYFNAGIADYKHAFRDGKIIKLSSDEIVIPEEFKNILRNERKNVCFPIINRGYLWYSNLSDSQKIELEKWYKNWLNVTDTLEAPEMPDWLK